MAMGSCDTVSVAEVAHDDPQWQRHHRRTELVGCAWLTLRKVRPARKRSTAQTDLPHTRGAAPDPGIVEAR